MGERRRIRLARQAATASGDKIPAAEVAASDPVAPQTDAEVTVRRVPSRQVSARLAAEKPVAPPAARSEAEIRAAATLKRPRRRAAVQHEQPVAGAASARVVAPARQQATADAQTQAGIRSESPARSVRSEATVSPRATVRLQASSRDGLPARGEVVSKSTVAAGAGPPTRRKRSLRSVTTAQAETSTRQETAGPDARLKPELSVQPQSPALGRTAAAARPVAAERPTPAISTPTSHSQQPALQAGTAAAEPDTPRDAAIPTGKSGAGKRLRVSRRERALSRRERLAQRRAHTDGLEKLVEELPPVPSRRELRKTGQLVILPAADEPVEQVTPVVATPSASVSRTTDRAEQSSLLRPPAARPPAAPSSPTILTRPAASSSAVPSLIMPGSALPSPTVPRTSTQEKLEVKPASGHSSRTGASYRPLGHDDTLVPLVPVPLDITAIRDVDETGFLTAIKPLGDRGLPPELAAPDSKSPSRAMTEADKKRPTSGGLSAPVGGAAGLALWSQSTHDVAGLPFINMSGDQTSVVEIFSGIQPHPGGSSFGAAGADEVSDSAEDDAKTLSSAAHTSAAVRPEVLRRQMPIMRTSVLKGAGSGTQEADLPGFGDRILGDESFGGQGFSSPEFIAAGFRAPGFKSRTKTPVGEIPVIKMPVAPDPAPMAAPPEASPTATGESKVNQTLPYPREQLRPSSDSAASSESHSATRHFSGELALRRGRTPTPTGQFARPVTGQFPLPSSTPSNRDDVLDDDLEEPRHELSVVQMIVMIAVFLVIAVILFFALRNGFSSALLALPITRRALERHYDRI